MKKVRTRRSPNSVSTCLHCDVKLVPSVNWAECQQKRRCHTCSSCLSERARKYRKANPNYASEWRAWDKKRKAEMTALEREKYIRRVRGYNLKKCYGMTIEQFEEMLTSQGGVCAICKGDSSNGKYRNLHVDHCHDTGKIRGILCNRCNSVLGYVEENIETLFNAANYLAQYRT